MLKPKFSPDDKNHVIILKYCQQILLIAKIINHHFIEKLLKQNKLIIRTGCRLPSVNSRLCVLGEHISGGGVTLLWWSYCFFYFFWRIYGSWGKSHQKKTGINPASALRNANRGNICFIVCSNYFRSSLYATSNVTSKVNNDLNINLKWG